MRAVRSASRRRDNYNPGPDCRVCGRKVINVVHETDPANAPQGRAYYDEHVPDRHEFDPKETQP